MVRLQSDVQVVIRPKLPIERVMFLISYAVGLGRWIDKPVEIAEAESLLEAVVPAFTLRVRRAWERGVLQGYRSEEAALPTVRGRWRIGDQISRRYGIAPPVEVSYDDYTEDTEPNRLIRAAIARLLGLRLRDPRWRIALRALESRLEGVELARYDARRVPEVTFDRRSEHYRGAVGLARMILSGASFDLAPGPVAASAFLIDMNKVFEDFVIVALRDALGVSERVLVQGARGKPLFLDLAMRVSVEPDISYWAGDRCLFVGDVKYKRIMPAGFPNADLYQLAAYTIATDLDSGVLVYAGGPAGDEIHDVRHIGKRLIIAPLDLDVPPSQLLGQIKTLASRIAPIAQVA